jgi:anti-sigma factor RsiW
MNCRDATEFLTDYLGGDLPADPRREFESHLGRCPDCRTFLAQYQITVKAGKRACGQDDGDAATAFPEDLLKAIMAAIQAQKP